MALSSHMLVPLMNTAPTSLDSVSSPAKRSPVFAANVRTASSWASPSTLIPKRGTPLSLGHVVEVFCTQNDTSGGSSETGTKVLAARPSRTPSTSAAMATTPVGKCPKASRSEDGVSLLLEFTGLRSHRRDGFFGYRPYSPDGVSSAIPVGCGHIRMCPQPALPGVLAIDSENRVRRIDFPAGLGGQLSGQRQHRNPGVQPRIEEVR